MNIPEWLIQHVPAIIAGACGGVVRTLSGENRTIRRLLSDVFIGAILAVYLGPFASKMLEPVFGVISLAPDQQERLGGFLMGVGGMVVVEIISSAWKRRKEDLERKDET